MKIKGKYKIKIIITYGDTKMIIGKFERNELTTEERNVIIMHYFYKSQSLFGKGIYDALSTRLSEEHGITLDADSIRHIIKNALKPEHKPIAPGEKEIINKIQNNPQMTLFIKNN